MHVQRTCDRRDADVLFELVEEKGQPVAEVSDFLRHLGCRGYSPNTLAAYAYDLLHFMRFLREHGWDFRGFTPARSLKLLEHLRHFQSQGHPRSLGPVLATDGGQPVRRLSPATINRILAAVSSFYEYLIIAGRWADENPLCKQTDYETSYVPTRQRRFISHQRPIRRIVRVRTVHRVPRPMTEELIGQLLASLKLWRDKAMTVLMLDGGLRPGEVLNLHLEDIQYGRRRVVIRYRTDHPRGARTKSRTERVVDLLAPETLRIVSTYVVQERPYEVDSPYVFLVGGRGERRNCPLSYAALVKTFARHCERLNIRTAWITPHALRHTHATRMWEGGMRELTLQKRLGHASPASTSIYTRVSDATMVAEYVQALGQREVK